MRRAILGLLVLAGCDDATPGTLLDGPRVLAIVAEPPVVAPGTSTRLEAIAAVDGLPVMADRVSWRACAPWAVVADPVRDCAGDAAVELTTGPAGEALIDGDELAARFGFEPPPPPTTTHACAAAAPTLTVVAELELDGARLIAKKDVPIAAAPDRRNPAFVQARIDGAAADAGAMLPAGATVRLGADIAIDTLDLACAPDGNSAREQVRIFVYPGGGAVADDDSFVIAEREGTIVAGSVELQLPGEPGDVPLWMVAVDETGGVAARFAPIVVGVD